VNADRAAPVRPGRSKPFRLRRNREILLVNRHARYALAAALALLPGSALAAARPSFDCAKASSDAEKAICADSGLARTDVAVMQAYRQLRQKLDAPAAAALAQDQKWFLSARDDALAFGGDSPTKTLLDLMTARAAFLNQVRVAGPTGLVGHWGNLIGDLTVKNGRNGALDVAVDAADPVSARWVCNASGTGKVEGDVLKVEVSDDGSTLTLARTGETLKIEASGPPNTPDWTPDYCGHNGSVEGVYFPLPVSKK